MSIRIHIIKTWLGIAFLIEADTGLILVDTGPPRTEGKILRLMQALGRDDLRLILLTHAHYDHFGSAAALKRLTGAPIAIHRIDADALAQAETTLGSVQGVAWLVKASLPLVEAILPVTPIPADIRLDDGDRLDDFGLAAQIIHTPGHTLGSSTLLVENRIAFVGDLISMLGRPHAQCRFAVDWQQQAQSLRRLQQFHPQEIYCGHGHQPLSGAIFQQLQPFQP
ncbi:MAG: MBL fold metallo-hydrolase [Anaerolineae bacterium]|nr:MBL fold metallo-hydrolase [Anaerolineae bacterium]